jgi:hypothetical protein
VLIVQSALTPPAHQSAFPLASPRRPDPAVTTSDSRRFQQWRRPCRHSCGVSPQGASTIMTILAEPPSITAAASCPAEPAPAVGQPRRRSTRVAAVGLCDRGEPADAADVDVAVAAGLLLRHPDQPPTEGSDGVGAPHSGCFGTDPDATVDRWPLRVADPAWVDGYRLVSRLGAGGMADVFYAVAPTGGPVAVKLLRAGDGCRGRVSGSTCWRPLWTPAAPHPCSATACRRRGRTW